MCKAKKTPSVNPAVEKEKTVLLKKDKLEVQL
jgi:hypothetical protein